jgi:hypothetical protein
VASFTYAIVEAKFKEEKRKECRPRLAIVDLINTLKQTEVGPSFSTKFHDSKHPSMYPSSEAIQSDASGRLNLVLLSAGSVVSLGSEQ